MKLIVMTAAIAMATPALAQAQDMSTTTTTQQTTTGDNSTPIGGYEPSAPPMASQPQPGQQVIFQPSPPVSQAFPPPAPKAEYPLCKKGQYDGCRQRGG